MVKKNIKVVAIMAGGKGGEANLAGLGFGCFLVILLEEKKIWRQVPKAKRLKRVVARSLVGLSLLCFVHVCVRE